MKYYIAPAHNEKSKRNAILRYVFMPEVMPRLLHLAQVVRRVFFIFPQILAVADLLPANHPYLNAATAHQNKVIDSFLLAWQNLKFTKKNIPKIGMFFAVFTAYFLLISMIIMGVLGLFFSFGSAQAQNYFSIPTNMPPYDQGSDWSFQMLAQIFGPEASNNFWGSAPGQNTGNVWYSALLVGAMALYARALAFIAVIMILYILVTALSSAARSGRPFGEQFDSVWAPLRFGIALALIIPFGGSYNGGQLIVFQTAEMGVNLANGVWLRALQAFGNQTESLMRTSISDRGVKFMRDVFLINTCYYGYGTLLREGDIDKSNGLMTDPVESRGIEMTTISYGNKKSPDYCGLVELPRTVRVPDGYLNFQPIGGGQTPNATNYLPNVILSHFEMSARQFLPQANGVAASSMGGDVAPAMIKNAFCERDNSFSELTCSDGQLCNNKIRDWFIGPEGYWRNAYGWTENNGFFSSASYTEAEDLFTSWIVSSLISDSRYGWASAGVFYIRMSAAMSSMENAINRLPRVVSLPINVSKIYATPEHQTITNQQAIDKCGGVNAGSTQICTQFKGSAMLSSFLREANTWMITAPKDDPELYSLLGGPVYDKLLQLPDGEPPATNNTASTALNFVTSTSLLRINDISIHPLGQVMMLGKFLLDVSTAIFAYAALTGAIGAFFGISFLLSTAMTFVTIAQFLVVPGFFLLVAIPMMPFIYFTMAVIEWATSVVDAVIGMPLWILTFITSQGDLVGGAMAGIKILFEIMLRPTIIVLSLLVAIIVFSAGMRFFGDSLELYMDAYGNSINNEDVYFASEIGANLAFVLIYAIGIYMMALSSFKLITVIPAQFGRWGNLNTGFGVGSTREGMPGGFAGMLFAASSGVGQVTGVAANATKGVMGFELNNIETKKAYDEWRIEETQKIQAENLEVSKYNSTISDMNKLRREKGESELQYKEYGKPPEEISMRDVRRAHFTNYRKKEYGSTLAYLKATKSRGNWSRPTGEGRGFGFDANMSSNMTNPEQSGGTLNMILGTVGWIGGEYIDFEEVPNKPSVSSSNAQGKMPSKEDILSAYSSLGLAAGATAADVKKRYKQKFDSIKRAERKFRDPNADAKLKSLLTDYRNLQKHLGFDD